MKYMTFKWAAVWGMLLFIQPAAAQKIDYSLVDKDDVRDMSFEILGKINNNILVYKNYRNRHAISVYDSEMQQKNRI